MGAVLSSCGRYRYRLGRQFGLGDRNVVFVGVNPSTADATVDDPTVRKWIGFAKRWELDRIEVVNLFAYRATDVRALAEAADPVGPENDAYLRAALAGAELVVPCWGSCEAAAGVAHKGRGGHDDAAAVRDHAAMPGHHGRR